MRRFILFILLFGSFQITAQEVSGIVRDSVTNERVLIANVILFQDSLLWKGTTTDLDGEFNFIDISEGQYRLEVSYIGYKPHVQILNIDSDQGLELDINLVESEDFIIACPIIYPEHPVSDHFRHKSNTLEILASSQEMAGTFGDPSRVLYRHTGLTTNNDQANGIIYRGLPSHLIKWGIEGAEIVNPNHLSNAGTLSDQSSASAGGVLAIPFEVISRFTFNGQPFGAENPNALAGFSDFEFGYQNQKSFLKLGLLGMEAAGFSQGNDVSVSAHARYSTVGLLSDMGVDFDGEKIKFQDLFFKVDFKKAWSWINVLAQSQNDKTPIDSIDNAVAFKDLLNINYKSDVIISGISFKGKRQKQSLFFSYKKDERKERLYSSLDEQLSFERDLKLSYHSEFKLARFRIGTNAKYHAPQIQYQASQFDESYFDFQPYVKWTRYFNPLAYGFKFEPSLSFYYDSFSEKVSFEPVINLQWVKQKHTLEINASKKSHLPNQRFLGLIDFEVNGNLERKRMTTQAISGSWKVRNFFGLTNFLSRIYYQQIKDIPGEVNSNILIRDYDLNESVFFSNYQTASTYGFEMMIDKTFNENFYLNTNISLFDAQSNSTNLSSNFGYLANVNVTKRFGIPLWQNSLLLNMAWHLRGGTHISRPELFGLIDDRLKPYWRIDFRMEYNWKEIHTLTLDIQNLTNRLNDGFYFRDQLLQETVLQKQLGLIPILSYKRLFVKRLKLKSS